MPNWCETNYCVYGDDKDELFKFSMMLRAAQTLNRTSEPGKLGNEWLGTIYLASGYTEKEIESLDWIECRGAIENIIEERDSENDPFSINCIYIQCSTAWCPMEDSFQTLLNNKFPHLKLDVLATEPGMELYVNTDTTGEHFKQAWMTDVDSDGEIEWMTGEDAKLLHYIKEKTGVTFKSVDEAMKNVLELNRERKLLTKDEDAWFCLHDFTF